LVSIRLRPYGIYERSGPGHISFRRLGEVHDELITLVESNSLRGKRIHDANVVAAAMYHHADAIVTDNAGDYAGISRVPVLSSGSAVDELRELM
jgi:hypothetical protein